MPNPWLHLPLQPPYVLPPDADLVREHDQGTPPDLRHQLQLFPEPYLGSPDAPVVLLSRKPGYAPGDDAVHLEPAFAAAARENLGHAHHPYPFYLLSPALAYSPGARYWRQKLGPVAVGVQDALEMEVEVAWAQVANGVMCVEYFPYHSKRYGWSLGHLPSFAYSQHLVRQAIDRRAVVVALRGVKDWTRAVPALANYDRLYTLNSAQNVTLSPRNCPAGFSEIVAAIAA